MSQGYGSALGFTVPPSYQLQELVLSFWDPTCSDETLRRSITRCKSVGNTYRGDNWEMFTELQKTFQLHPSEDINYLDIQKSFERLLQKVLFSKCHQTKLIFSVH